MSLALFYKAYYDAGQELHEREQPDRRGAVHQVSADRVHQPK